MPTPRFVPRLCLTTLLAIGLVGAASAQTATFKYATSDAPDMIYERFQKTAKKVCLDHLRGEGPMAIGMVKKRRAICEADLLDKAVSQTELPAVIAIHKADPDMATARLLASRSGVISE
ncbi:MAG: hypothetical protein AAF253_00820 [Pseudomonadota bacterium]